MAKTIEIEDKTYCRDEQCGHIDHSTVVSFQKIL